MPMTPQFPDFQESTQPMDLDPLARESLARVRHEPFAWPSPPLPQYAPASTQLNPEPCEIVGLNGHLIHGRMTYFDPDTGSLYIQVPPSRTTMVLRFDQFRSLRLTVPMQPLGDLTGQAATPELAEMPVVPYTVRLRGAAPAQGLTVLHEETEHGLFLFEPVDQRGAVRRCFFPREGFEGFEVGDVKGGQRDDSLDLDLDLAPRAATAAQAVPGQPAASLPSLQQIVSPQVLEKAIDEQQRMPMVRIGQALLAMGMVTREQLDEALGIQRMDRSTPLGEILVRRGVVSREDLQAALSRKMGYPLVDVDNFPVDLAAVAKLPFAVARRLPALPLLLRDGRLIVAMEDPTRKTALNEVEFAAQCKIVPVLARIEPLPAAVDRAYEKIGARLGTNEYGAPLEHEQQDATKLLASLEQQHATDEPDWQVDERPIEQSDNSLVRLINSMILEAHLQGASDIHIECQPGREKVKVRFRKDGQLRPYLELPHTYRHAMIARLKIMCDLDISERRKPQDGKIAFGRFVPGTPLELRLATIPTQGGLEDAVLRLLSSAKLIPLDALNLSPRNLAWIKEAIQRPHGMILCAGPTGSGKTTTLHSAIGFINVPERKIWTAEDPIEITQPGLRQVQMNAKIDWTFAKAMRAFLRADPDVIMVGEIRDNETAHIAIEASLTGHLVLSTLHTNSAVETVTRLIDMGMDPFNFADSLLAVLGQRLVRRLCPKCRTSREASSDEVAELLDDYLMPLREVELPADPDEVLADWIQRFGVKGRLHRWHSPGCELCDQLGYRGRIGIHELLTVSRTMRHLIQTRKRTDELQRVALSEGMRTLRQDGIEKMLAGITSLEEVRANSY